MRWDRVGRVGLLVVLCVVAGLYVRAAGTVEALAAILGGVAVMVGAHLATAGRGFPSPGRETAMMSPCFIPSR